MPARGEYKMPGGKLIAVEFDVRDSVLRDVSISGDFFLYPDDALPRLAAALDGLPSTLDENAYAARIQPVLDSNVELLGSSAKGLGIAVVRALEARVDADPDASI